MNTQILKLLRDLCPACLLDKPVHLADPSHAGHQQFVVAVALHSYLTEEQVDLIVISHCTQLALWDLSHGHEGGL